LNEHNVSRYKYDGNGNKTEEDIQKPGGNLGPKYEYKYDDKARLTEVDEFYEMGDFKNKMEYDDKGNKTEQVVYRADGTLDEDNALYWEYQYDSTGNNTKKSEYH